MTKDIRLPAVSGAFYPAQTEELWRAVDGFLSRATRSDEPAVAVICPHAGYMYSGAVAGEVLGGINLPQRVILLGPKHRRAGAPAAVDGSAVWRFPFGDVELDRELCAAVANHARLAVDSVAHRDEHCLEVQVPFLYRRQPELLMTPIVLGFEIASRIVELGEGLARAIQDAGEPVLVLASTDMSHYLPEAEAKRLDALALAQVERLDPDALLHTVMKNDISMCGVIPTAVALHAARALGATKASLVRYATSGETSGDRSAVVGYAGFIIR